MRLAAVHQGPSQPAHLRLAFIHGFTQTSRSWLPVIDELSDSYTCTSLDAPGHGDSTDGCRSLWECADDITESTEPCILIGYSMGARMALHAALAHPHHFKGLVLVSGTAGISSETERSARLRDDNILADHIENVGTPTFISEWLANPLFRGLTESTRMVDDRIRNSSRGLADSLRHAGTGTQEPLWDRLSDLPMPCLIVTGADDPKFVELGRKMAARIPRATFVCVESSGHTVHLEQTHAFTEHLASWLHLYNASEMPTA